MCNAKNKIVIFFETWSETYFFGAHQTSFVAQEVLQTMFRLLVLASNFWIGLVLI
jgi:hypothetical protein